MYITGKKRGASYGVGLQAADVYRRTAWSNVNVMESARPEATGSLYLNGLFSRNSYYYIDCMYMGMSSFSLQARYIDFTDVTATINVYTNVATQKILAYTTNGTYVLWSSTSTGQITYPRQIFDLGSTVTVTSVQMTTSYYSYYDSFKGYVVLLDASAEVASSQPVQRIAPPGTDAASARRVSVSNGDEESSINVEEASSINRDDSAEALQDA